MLAREGCNRGSTADVDPRVAALCGEFDVEIVPKSCYPKEGQTRAVGSIRRLIHDHGAAHARLVLCVLAKAIGQTKEEARSLVSRRIPI
ncbi:hypothetical protein NKJ51_23760 [Mesorhizobium sp. M0134]|uniref:hypothetical protein n=1 Tax=Mesorhizobium sp. M0134 TaxID=2956889 RepID=UPI00333B8375